MGAPFVQQELTGWGRYPVQNARVYRPEKQRTLHALAAAGNGERDETVIARGLGRSYGDPALNEGGGVVLMTRLNRMLAFDPATRVLRCEAGVSLEEIIEVFLPRGYFLPVTPGTKFVTVGGAIANDVHGKNHHRDGSFAQFVRRFELITPGGEKLVCSPEENEKIFWATVGGVGLTGFILSAEIELLPVETAWMKVDYRRTGDIQESLRLMEEHDPNYRYSVAWIDCLAKGKQMGRAVLMHGKHALKSDLKRKQAAAPLKTPKKRAKRVPFDLPDFFLNKYTVGMMNAAYYRINPTAMGKIVDYDSYFYPLDSVHEWNRGYGKAGFIQYQAMFPKGQAEGLIRLLERLSQSGRGSLLAVLKRFGPGNPGLLSYPAEGYTLALDLPMRPGLLELCRELDRLLLDHGGRLYLAKDATTDAETFAQMYPRLDEFRAIKGELDPEGRLSSSIARRLKLAPGTTGSGVMK